MPKSRKKATSRTDSPHFDLARLTEANRLVVHDGPDTRSSDPPDAVGYPVLDQAQTQSSTIFPGSSVYRPASSATLALTSSQYPVAETSPEARNHLGPSTWFQAPSYLAPMQNTVDQRSVSSLIGITTPVPRAASSLRIGHLDEASLIVSSQLSHVGPNHVLSFATTPIQRPRAPAFGLPHFGQATATPLCGIGVRQGPPLSPQPTRYTPYTHVRESMPRHSRPSSPSTSTLAPPPPTNTAYSRAGLSAIIPRSPGCENFTGAQRSPPLFGSVAASRSSDRATPSKQPHQAQYRGSTMPDSAGAASTRRPSYPTVTVFSPGGGLGWGSLITQTANAHASIHSPEVNTVTAQYRTTQDLQPSPERVHLSLTRTTENYPSSSSSRMAVPYPIPIPSTRTYFGSASQSIVRQDYFSSESAIQFEGTNMRAGGDIGSKNTLQQGGKNILQQGDGNQIHIHSTGATDRHEVVLLRIEKKMSSYIATDATLSKEVHGYPSLCYQGTRENLLEIVLSWVEGGPAKAKEDVNDLASRALCIVGAPGSGKSTIMNTIILDLLRDARRRSPGLISAHYCIRRSLQSTTDSSKVLPTLSLQLARRDPGIANRISTILHEALHTDVLTLKFQEEVFLEAISAYNQVVFVIIDALDEASQPADLAAMLSRVIHSISPNVRLLLSTRNEHGVLQGLGPCLIPSTVREIPTEESLDEVGAYIVNRLRDGIHKIFGDSLVWRDWPDDSQLRGLSIRAGGLFIWARTAVDYILSRIQRRGLVNRNQWIEDVETVGLADVNSLYLFILMKQLETEKNDTHTEDEAEIQAGMIGVFGFIIVAEHPLALDDLVGLLDLSDFDITHFVTLARSILVPGTEPITGSTIPQMHKTFVDFITSERASAFHIDIQHHHCKAADWCFAVMASKLRFNIAGLRSSLSKRADLKEVAISIPGFLFYASTQWWYHLDKAGVDQLPSDITHIRAFVEDKLLFWLEVLVLLDQTRKAQDWLRNLGERLTHRNNMPDPAQLDLADLTQDASRLMIEFEECIEASIPHIYISLLAFSPDSSRLVDQYRRRSEMIVIPRPFEMPSRWDPWEANPRMADDGSVLSVSFSPCGRHLATGYGSNSVRVWDVETGECAIGPLKGHSDFVRSLCYSPSGLMIASGSDDKTIRVWDAETGKCILGPLTGHTGHVASVLFSPNSTRIASGSWDGTVRLWDVRTGDCVLGPLEGHSNYVRSVSYSPDGSCIASGSDDKTIRLWNAKTGACVCRPLEGHEDSIYSLSFHPDGRQLVSGSIDKALRIWDVQNGTCTHGPLTGHGDAVSSVCSSSDGRYIASGSYDCTIRIWDAETARCIAGPFSGASNNVGSVAISPEGKYLAAGSWDGTARLWDFKALLRAGMCGAVRDDEAFTNPEITDHTAVEDNDRATYITGSWTLGPNGEYLFWTPDPYDSAIWRPSTVRVLGRPSMIKPDLSNLVTGEEWLSCFPSTQIQAQP